MKTLALLWLASASSYARDGAATALTANGPNSVTLRYSSAGNLSFRIACGTSGSRFPIVTPWIPITGEPAAGSAVAAQLQPSTHYYCRFEGAESAGGKGNVLASGRLEVTTTPPIQTYPLEITLGATTSYNAVQFPANGRWTDQDTAYYTQLSNGTIVMQGNDGNGPQRILSAGEYTQGRNAFLSTVDPDFTNISLLNPMGTGDGTNGFGGAGTGGVPGCYSRSSTIKSASLFAQGNTLYWAFFRVNPTPFDSWIARSDDGGATWYNPSHTPEQASPHGDPPCPGAGVMWSDPGSFAEPRFVKYGRGGAVTNPVGGIDAYFYLQFRNTLNTAMSLGRCYKLLNPQKVANWEYYVGPVGGDENLPSRWTTSQGHPASLAPLGEGQSDQDIQWLPDFGRFIMTAEAFLGPNDTRMVVYDSAQLTGPWVKRFQEPDRTPSNPALGQHLERAWLSLFMPTYHLSETTPPKASVKVLHSGTYTQKSNDPPNNLYSPWLVDITITTAAPLESPHNLR
jgi:hypothetical protein